MAASPGSSFETDFKDHLDVRGLTFEDLKAHQCPDSVLLKLSEGLDNWDTVGLYLACTLPEIKAIKVDNSSEEIRRVALLNKWQQKNGYNATYYNLVSGLLDAERVDIADQALDYLKENIIEIRRQQKEEEERQKEERRQQEIQLEYQMKENFAARIKTELLSKGLVVADLQVNLRQEDVGRVAELIGKDWYTFGKNMKVEESTLDHIKEVGKDKLERKRKLLEYLISKKICFEDVMYGLYDDLSINYGILEYLLTIRITRPEDVSKWLKEGTVNLTVKRVQMLGPPGSGKTCSRCLLLNEDPPPKNDSTPIACRAVKATRISVENGHMKEVDAKALLSRLAGDLKEAAAKQKETPTEDHDTKSLETIPADSPETKATESADATESTDAASDYHSDKFRRDIVEAIPKAKAKLDRHLVYIVDSGGQTAFQELLPLFTRAASLNIIAIDLSKGMDEKLDLQYRIDGASFPCDSNFSYTNIEFLNNVLSSGAMLQLYHSPQSKEDAATFQYPEYFVLGTHSDDVKVTPQKIAEFNEALSTLTGTEEKGYRIIPAEQNGDIIYPVNTVLEPGPKRQKESKNLCDTIFDFDDTLDDNDTIQLPVRWFAFELTLLEKAGNDSVLHMNDVLSIGRSLEMNEDDTKEALHHLHNVTIILYYPQVLPNIVFVDPHPILDILSRLLALTYKIERKYLRWLTRKTPSESELVALSRKGVFTKSLLDKLNDNQGFSKSDFIKLLLHLCIIVETQDGYFIPSALPPFGSTGLPPDSDIIESLLIVWRNPVTKEILPVPRGIFPLAVVSLMKFKQPQFQFAPDSEEYLRCRDAISFRVHVHEFIGTIHIIKKHKHIEIYFESDRLEYCPLICEAVTEAIHSSSEAIHLKPLYKLAFACCSTKQCEKKCYCIVTNEAEEKVECTLCRKPALISGQEKYWNWFHVTHAENSTKASKTLDITGLQKVLHLLRECHFNGDWEGLGLELGLYKQPTLSNIQHSYTREREAALRECLSAWLQRTDAVNEYGGATYVSLAHALERLGQKSVADDICKKCQINLPQEESSIVNHILDITCLRDVRLSLSDLNDSRWRDLGGQLCLPPETLKSIENDYFDDRWRLRETLVKWLEGADGVSPSWASLVKAQKDIAELK